MQEKSALIRILKFFRNIKKPTYAVNPPYVGIFHYYFMLILTKSFYSKHFTSTAF